MKRSDIERVIRETYEARRDEDVDGVLAHFTKDATFRLSAGERFGPYSLTVSGHEDLRHHFRQLFSTWDFRRFQIGELVIDEGGSPVRAAAHLEGTIRHAPSGREFAFELVDFMSFRDARIASVVEFFDTEKLAEFADPSGARAAAAA